MRASELLDGLMGSAIGELEREVAREREQRVDDSPPPQLARRCGHSGLRAGLAEQLDDLGLFRGSRIAILAERPLELVVCLQELRRHLRPVLQQRKERRDQVELLAAQQHSEPLAISVDGNRAPLRKRVGDLRRESNVPGLNFENVQGRQASGAVRSCQVPVHFGHVRRNTTNTSRVPLAVHNFSPHRRTDCGETSEVHALWNRFAEGRCGSLPRCPCWVLHLLFRLGRPQFCPVSPSAPPERRPGRTGRGSTPGAWSGADTSRRRFTLSFLTSTRAAPFPLEGRVGKRQLCRDTSENIIPDVARFTISAHQFELDADAVEKVAERVLPDPIRTHYVVVRGRRYPPKQVLEYVTGLDRADFTTHQARRILKRLGFVAARVKPKQDLPGEASANAPHGGRQAAALAPHVGKWVALASPTAVLVAADTPEDVLAWLSRHERRAPYGMFRVPSSTREAEGLAPE